MSKDNFHFAAQLLSGVAILIGLALVVWELRQTQDLVRAQLVSEGWLELTETARASLSETFADTRAKACMRPLELSESELVEMSTYHWILIDQIERSKGYQDIGRFTATSWETLAHRNLEELLSSEIGRAEYETWNLRPYLKTIGDAILADSESPNCGDYYQSIVFRLESNLDD